MPPLRVDIRTRLVPATRVSVHVSEARARPVQDPGGSEGSDREPYHTQSESEREVSESGGVYWMLYLFFVIREPYWF